MKIIKNFALAMLLVWIFQLGFNSCANLVKGLVFKNISIFYEDKSEHVLEAHRAAYGAVGLLAAIKHGKNLRKGRGDGILAGEIAYLGKKIARKRGFGAVGQVVHSLGASMLENQLLNKPLFSRYKVFLPPVSLEFDIQEGFSCKFLLGSLIGILVNLADLERVAYFEPSEIDKDRLILLGAMGASILIDPNKFLATFLSTSNEHYSLYDSLLAGNPVFVSKTLEMNLPECNIGGVIAVEQNFNAFSHEIIHTCQYRESAIINLFIERRFIRGFPLLFSQDVFYIFYMLCEDFQELVEEEPEEYDRIYQK